MTNSFKPSARGVMLALVAAAFSGAALANTGKVDFAAGGVTVTNAEGRVQQLVKGAEVRSGDKIVSATDGRAQIRFSDGAYVSLQPNTEFDIKEYRYDGKTDGTESAVFSLFKGALRTVTGLVGRVNRNKYQITTPTATIGIRGTGGLVQIGANGSTLVTGTSGIWTLSNNGGTVQIPAGSSGFAGNPNLPPKQTTEGPIVPPAQPPEQPATFVQADNRTSNGVPDVFPKLASGPGYVTAVTYGGVNASPVSLAPSSPVDAVFDSSGRLTQFTVDFLGTLPGFTISSVSYTLAGSHAPAPETGTDGVLAWGRWTGTVLASLNGGSSSTINFGPNEGLHYVVGTPTPVASLPTANTTFTYNPIGATAPTYVNGSAAPGVLSLDPSMTSLKGNFVTGAVNLSLGAKDGNGLTFIGSANGTMNTRLAGANFSASGSATGSGCSGSCSLSADGFFAGNGATRAGIAYVFSGTAQGSNLIGAAAFKQQ